MPDTTTDIVSPESTPAATPAAAAKPAAQAPAPVGEPGQPLTLEFLWDEIKKQSARMVEEEKKSTDHETRIKALEDTAKDLKTKQDKIDSDFNARLKSLEATNWGEKYADVAKRVEAIEAEEKKEDSDKSMLSDLEKKYVDLANRVGTLEKEEKGEV